MQAQLDIWKSISVIDHINKLKNKNYKVISTDAEKVFTKFNIHVWLKKLMLNFPESEEHTST